MEVDGYEGCNRGQTTSQQKIAKNRKSFDTSFE